MRAMKAAGIGGFEVQTVYPLVVDGNFPYLSDQFLDDLRFTAEKARELGLRMDVTLGSGWPFGGPHIPITLAAGRLRVERSTAEPLLGDGEKLLTVFPMPGLNSATAEQMQLFFISSHTRQKVKRAAAGAEGYVLDHYDREAIDTHLKSVGDRLMQAMAGNPPYAVFSDSLEVYGSDWTGDFLEEFQRRRGYDLRPYLSSLVGDASPTARAIRHDWGQTLTELANEHYLEPIRQWANQHGTRFRSQTYGIPPVTLSSNALVDLPEGEGWRWRQFSATRWAASASHLYGKPVTSSETWTWLHSPVFRATPLDMKAEADLNFLEGINQLIGHGWPYSPPAAGEPGWRFYAAGALNDHNPWWIVMPDVALYLQRVSFLLRQGKPDNGVAIYLPTDDAWAGFTLGHDSINQSMNALIGPEIIPQILDSGYNYDFIDDPAIERVGIPYRILILPGVERIPLASYQKIDEFARHGGIVIATRRLPSLAPGFLEIKAGDPKISALSESLFESQGSRGHFLKDENGLGAMMKAALPPDMAVAPEIGFVHRKLDFADAYFVVNTSNHPVTTMATFRTAAGGCVEWDPFTGDAHSLSKGNRVELQLAPYESRILVFSNDRVDPAPTRTVARDLIDLSSGWTVKFPSDSTPTPINPLRSWTGLEGKKFFSGTAEYQRNINLQQLPKSKLFLNFGEGVPLSSAERNSGDGMRAMLESPVREAAIVYVNGKRAGSVWHPPYEIEIGGLLHSGQNTIRVVAGNLAINELARAPLPDYKDLKARYGDRFQQQDMGNMQPLPSGLLGPVHLVSRK